MSNDFKQILTSSINSIVENVSGGGKPRWDNIEGKPETYSPAEHSHEVGDIKNLTNALTDFAKHSDLPTWSTLAGRPSVYGASYTGKLTWGQVTGAPDFALRTDLPTWGTLTGKPSAFPPSSHRHAAGDLDGVLLSSDASKFMLKIRTVTTTERKRTTFNVGELVMDKEENRLYMGDGETSGGRPVGSGGGSPTGMIAMFHASQPPEGWLLCNGAEVNQSDYPDLFAVIGTTYGEGSGSDTFNLPNLNHRFLEGTTSSSEVGQYIEAGLPNITGRVDLFVKNSDGAFYVANGGGLLSSNTSSRKSIYFDASRSNRIYGASNTVQPASVRLLACIKY